MITIREVAKKAQVSVATVSRVLNGSPKVSAKSREAVLKAQKELGFYLNANARALVQRDSHTIGVVVSDVSDPYFGNVIRACEDVVHNVGYNLLVSQGYHNVQRERQAIDDLLTYQCRGLVVHALTLSDQELRNYLEKIPYMVLINRVLPGFEQRCLTCDNYSGERMAVEELIRQGHTKIAYIGSSHKILDSRERRNGYLDSLKAHHLKSERRLMSSGEPSLEGGAAAATALLEHCVPGEDFTAIACYSDVMAAGVMGVLYQNHYRIPEDISITGFDNLYLSRCLTPQLTTIDNPICTMAQEAVKRSIALYEGRSIPEQHTLEVKLIVRNSIKNLNAAATSSAAVSDRASTSTSNQTSASELTQASSALSASIAASASISVSVSEPKTASTLASVSNQAPFSNQALEPNSN